MQTESPYLINGSFEQTLSPLDRGFAYGDGVFRTLKIVDGLPQNWPLHYQKLVSDCAAIGIVCPSAELLMADFQQLYTPEETAVLKIIVTRGEGKRGYAPPAITVPTRVLLKSPIPAYPPQYFVEGVQLYLCETRLSHQPKLAGIKHLNRLENVLARAEWDSVSYADGLLMDVNDHVIECTSCNVFARFGDTLLTPDLTQCGVAGVTRERILQLARNLSLQVSVEKIKLDKLLSADEVLICNSLLGTVQVTALADKTWPVISLASDLRMMLAI